MAEIIPFQTREERQKAALTQLREDAEQLTGLELYNLIRQYAYNTMDDLIIRLKQTGKWNDTANSLMRRAIENVNAACAAIAGVQHGTTKNEGSQGSGGPIIVNGAGKPASPRPTVNTAAFFGVSGTGGDGRSDSNSFDSKRRDDSGGFDRTDCDPGDCS